jgi:hypothetical protein
MMTATIRIGASTHYGMKFMCHKHKRLLILDHIETFDTLKTCSDIREYANMLKNQQILDFSKENILHGIALFGYLTVKIQNLR